jgi:hypothetical protein
MARLDEEISLLSIPKKENAGSYEPLPDGWYDVTIGGCELKDTKAGTGKYLHVKYEVTGPSHSGRVVFGNLNIRNANPKAEEIGRQQLGELMSAVSIGKLSDTDELIGTRCRVKLTTRKSEQYGDSNEVKGWKAPEGLPAGKASSGGTRSAPPWAKK